jgi:hypothetical protein
MRYSEFHPRSPLNQVIECCGAREQDWRYQTSDREKILRDGCIELISEWARSIDRYRFHPDTVPFFRLRRHELTNEVVDLSSFAQSVEAKSK